jgi:hypothetical protein
VRLRRHSNSIPQTGFLIAFGLAGGCHSCRRRRGQAFPEHIIIVHSAASFYFPE